MTLISGEKFWPISDEPKITPLPFKKMLGRPRILKKKEEHEKGDGERLHRTGREMTCQYYFDNYYCKKIPLTVFAYPSCLQNLRHWLSAYPPIPE